MVIGGTHGGRENSPLHGTHAEALVKVLLAFEGEKGGLCVGGEELFVREGICVGLSG